MNRSIFLMVGVLLLSGWLGLRSVNADPIWYDEYRSFYYAGWETETPIPLNGTIQRVAGSDVQAPAYFLMLNAWGWLTGRSIFAGRVLSVLFGLLALAAIYRLGTDADGRRTGLLAATMTAVSGFYVIYTHEIRVYTLLVFVITLTLWGYWRLVHDRRLSASIAVLTGVCAALTPYLHYMGATVLLALGLYHLIFVRKNRRWWTVMAIGVTAGLAFAPWARLAATALDARVNEEPILASTLGIWGSLSAIGDAFSSGATALLLVLLGAALIGWRRSQVRFALTLTVIPIGLLLALDEAAPALYHPRYFLVVWPSLALLAAIGLRALSAYRVPVVLILGVWVVFGINRSLDTDYRREANLPGAYMPWDTTANALDGWAQAGDLMMMMMPDGAFFQVYHPSVAEYYLRGTGLAVNGLESLERMTDDEYVRRGLAAIADYDRVWLASEPRTTPSRAVVFEWALDDTYLHCSRGNGDSWVNSDDLRLSLWAAPSDEVVAEWDEGIRLMRPTLNDESPTDQLIVVLQWAVAESVPPHTYSFALHLLDENGTLVAQADDGLPGVGQNCRAAEIDLRGVAPGRYRLAAQVYAWESGNVLLWGDDDEQERVDLGWVTVE
jgi:hypothetical protein